MADNDRNKHYETLQVSPEAEPEVIAAAYRALAKKYHPDRSEAPDAMAKMAQLNVAYQAVRGDVRRVSANTPANRVAQDLAGRFSNDSVEPDAPLEQMLEIISRKVSVARQRVIEEVAKDGLAKDIATGLVNKALKGLVGAGNAPGSSRGRATDAHLDAGASYDEAMRIVEEKAGAVRDRLADELVKDGLQRSVAAELVDSAFERVRRRTADSEQHVRRLSSAHVDLTASLDRGTKVVAEKVVAARQLVIEELTRDGLPQRTAQQLVQSAMERVANAQRTW
jgi:polyhydroxyalkanoate synthesis regulator phasin